MIKIRPFEKRDRSAVRALACGTAEAGKPSSFHDQVMLADLLTMYYTDVEPQSTLVADDGERVVGYLTGCLNTHRYLAWLKQRGHWITVARFIGHDLFRPDMWRWAKARVKTLREGGAHREPWISRYPAHLHINLAESARGQGVGAQLMESFFTLAKSSGVEGIHLATRGDNTIAQGFFKAHGFAPLTTINAYRATPHGFDPVHVLIMARPI